MKTPRSPGGALLLSA